MNTDLRTALAEAAHEGHVHFEARPAADTIAPATERVRRQRKTTIGLSAFAAFALVALSTWGLEELGESRLGGFQPAVPSEPPADAAERMNERPWSTTALAAVTEVRSIGEKRIDSVAGMICHHDEPTDDPRVALLDEDPVTTHAVSVEDCAPVWFKDGPLTADANATATWATGPVSLSSRAVVANTSVRPLEIDRESIFMWIETEPTEMSDAEVSVYAPAIFGTSMWDSAGANIALLDSGQDPVTLWSGRTFVVSAEAGERWTGGALGELIESGAEFTVTFWARIHEENPSGDSTYLIQLGEAHTYGGPLE